jgi:alkylhydroperoxidase family enzyme
MARLPYADDAQLAELIRRAAFPEHTPSTNAFRMLAHAPAVAAPALRLVAAVLTATDLDPRLRQLVILWVTQRCQARYAWIQHAAIARAVGVSETLILALERGEVSSALFTDRERVALAFVDEILDGPRVSDDTFAAVRGRFSSREVVELLLTVGYFRMIGSLLTTLDVELDAAWAAQALEREHATARSERLGRCNYEHCEEECISNEEDHV